MQVTDEQQGIIKASIRRTIASATGLGVAIGLIIAMLILLASGKMLVSQLWFPACSISIAVFCFTMALITERSKLHWIFNHSKE